MYALISLTDKTGVETFAANLAKRGFTIIATGGTASAIAKAGIAVREAGEITGVGEIMGGRVKTLSPMIFAGILARRHDVSDMADRARVGAPDIRLVVCNLYRFDANAPDPVPGIDIGGVALIRAAAKNYRDVAVLVDPSDYADFIATCDRGAEALAAKRVAWAAKAWDYIADYDAAIAGAYAPHRGDDRVLRLSFARHRELRYGENPHQSATWWRGIGSGLHEAQTLEGKELSYNNILDISAASGLVADLGPDGAAIIKHQNPCGAARCGSAAASLAAALETDRAAAFGGVIAVNGTVDLETVNVVEKLFFEVIVAPSFSEDAIAKLAKKKNLRIVTWPRPDFGAMEYRTAPGGLLTQSRDAIFLPDGATVPKVVSKRAPSESELRDMLTGDIIAKHVRSNAVVLVKDGATVGIGAGQMNRADSVRIAVMKAGERASGAVMASDAFFPFSDGVENATGVTAVIQPGGSIRDEEVIAAADRLGMALVFTGVRHFRH